jgi:hypothetical protein
MKFPDTPHGNAQSAMQILFQIQAVFRLLILVDDENALARVREGDFFEAIQYTGELGEDLVGKAVHYVSLLDNFVYSQEKKDGQEKPDKTEPQVKTGRKELAELISQVLKNPETPQPLKDTIHDALSFMSQYADDETPEVIEMYLNAYEENGFGAKIEVTRANGVSVVCEDEGEI